jgi:hypothetical protein
MLPRQLGVAFGHLDIRVAENFGQLIKVAAVHHVPGRERVPQIVKTEVRNPCLFEYGLETPFHSKRQSKPPVQAALCGDEVGA